MSLLKLYGQMQPTSRAQPGRLGWGFAFYGERRASLGIPAMSLIRKVGEDVFLHRAREITASQPLFSWLGASIVSVSEGYCEMQLPLREEFVNDRNTVQGTVLFALLEAATFVASRTLVRGRTEMDFHQEMKINFIKAVRKVNQTIKAHGRALHRGRSTAVVEGEVYDEAGDLVAKALGTIAILRY